MSSRISKYIRKIHILIFRNELLTLSSLLLKTGNILIVRIVRMFFANLLTKNRLTFLARISSLKSN